MVTKFATQPESINFLRTADSLYACDFRAISESMEYEISAMWKYENLLPWIVSSQVVVVNEDSVGLKYFSRSKLIVLPKTNDSRISVFKRYEQGLDIKRLWVAIPHPDADKFAADHDLELNYSYSDFLIRNNKLRQKSLVGDKTPKWVLVESKEHINELAKRKGFFKRTLGSGGFTVFDSGGVLTDKNFLKLYENDQKNWYFEDFVDGKSFSIQCYKYKQEDKVYLFGYSEQQLVEGKYFIGSHMLKLDQLRSNAFDQLERIVIDLGSVLKGYEGFFGIDFIVDPAGKVNFLEANVRLTAATIPTLLFNKTNSTSAEYKEDLSVSELKDTDIILALDKINNNADVLRLSPAEIDVEQAHLY